MLDMQNMSLAIMAVAIAAALSAGIASAEPVRGVTSDEALEVVITPGPDNFGMEFVNPLTGQTQEHVDYTVSVSNQGEYIFGPIPLTHTSPGSVTIPAILGEGTNHISISVHGILFIPIDEETLTLEVVLDGSERAVPEWIKTSAGWWSQGEIDDGTFLTGIEYLISEGIIVVEVTSRGDPSDPVPEWIRTTAGWWSEGVVSDGEFLNALEYLISEGMISVATAEPLVLGGVDLSGASAPYGSADAPISIIEFGDYQCPKCGSWFANTRPAIQSEYVDTATARIYFVDLVFLGADSGRAASASYCAEEQGMYWEYHDTLYQNQGGIQAGWASHDSLIGYAADIGLDTDSFGSCLAQDHGERIAFNQQQSQSNGIDRTPSFVIVGPAGVEIISGNQPFAAFEAAIQRLLE